MGTLGILPTFLVVATAIWATLALSLPAQAVAAPSPPFTECPPIGQDTGCAVLIVVNADGSTTKYVDPSQGQVDGADDVLVGVLNSSSSTITSLPLTGNGIFAFDGDGLCTLPSAPSGCPFGPTTYEGPNSSFSLTDQNSGTVAFPKGLAPGAGTYFSLEGDTSSVAPPPPGIVLGVLDLNAYCTSRGFAKAALSKPQKGLGYAYNNWVCVALDGSTLLTDMQSACEAAYSQRPIFAQPTDPDDAYSWRCYQRIGITPPSNTAAPTVSGSAEVGRVLSEHHGQWTGQPSTFTYQWEACSRSGGHCSLLAGATGQSYEIRLSDVGRRLRVVEAASNAAGPGRSVASRVTRAVPGPRSVHPGHCPIPGPRRLHWKQWSLRLAVTSRSGTVAEDVSLGGRLLTDRMSNPLVMVATRRHPEGLKLGLEVCGSAQGRSGRPVATSHLREPLPKPKPLAGNPPAIAYDVHYDFMLDPQNRSSSHLLVTQRFIFEQEFVEGLGGNNAPVDCEPSNKARIVFPSQHPCGRWRLVLSYKFSPGKGDRLYGLAALEKLHFKPDGKQVQGTTLVHDCNVSEFFDAFDDLCVNGPGGYGRIPGLPGLADFDSANPLRYEVAVPAILLTRTTHGFSNTAGFVDNLHLTTNSSVGLPVPIPPGCPECVHIHWRWGQDTAPFSGDFGRGAPLIGCCNSVPSPDPGAAEETIVALVSNGGTSDRQSRIVGQGANSHVGAFQRPFYGTGDLRDPVVVFDSQAPGQSNSGAFFAWGGFFCSPMTVSGKTYGC